MIFKPVGGKNYTPIVSERVSTYDTISEEASRQGILGPRYVRRKTFQISTVVHPCYIKQSNFTNNLLQLLMTCVKSTSSDKGHFYTTDIVFYVSIKIQKIKFVKLGIISVSSSCLFCFRMKNHNTYYQIKCKTSCIKQMKSTVVVTFFIRKIFFNTVSILFSGKI